MSNWSTPFGSPQSTRGPSESPSSRPAKYPAPRRGRRRAESLSHPRIGRWTESADILEDFAAELSAESFRTKPGEDYTAGKGFSGTGYEGLQGGDARVPVRTQAGFSGGPDGPQTTLGTSSRPQSSRAPSKVDFYKRGYQKFQGDQSRAPYPCSADLPHAKPPRPPSAPPYMPAGPPLPKETGYTAGYQEVQKKYQYRSDQSRTPYPCSAHPAAPPNMPVATPAVPTFPKSTRADYERKIEKMVRPYGLELKQSKKAEFCVNKGRGVWTRSREAKTVELSYLERDPASKTEARKYLCNESGSDEITALEKVYTELKKRGLHDYEQY
ncbi:hypothetical protein DFH11DRAFT_1544078 [Phellopilus nigrolimitatus]|nr:hypothetical protein DFH11DRAFT_1544078 [Phellopilus nigrolimitatus]